MRLATFISLAFVLGSACSDEGFSFDTDVGGSGSSSGSGPGTTPTATMPASATSPSMTNASADGDDGTSDGDTAGTTEGPASTGSDGDGSGTASDTGRGTAQDSGSGGSTGEEPAVGVCVAACEAAEDCCPFGALGCPSDEYPNNWSCAEGACQLGGCESDQDCETFPLPSAQECLEVAGVGACLDVCESDQDCFIGSECVGTTDDGTMYCTTPTDACESDDDCDGDTVCDL